MHRGMALPLPARILLAALLGSLVLAAPAFAVRCGADRCRSFAAASGAEGAMASGPDGAVWFAGDGFVGRLAPDGDVKRFPAPTTGSSDVEAGPDGGIWFTGPGLVGRMDTSGNVTFQRSVGGSPGPIAPAADGAMWFATSSGFLSRVAADGDLLRLTAPGKGGASASAARALGGPGTMVKGPDGALWFVHSDPAGIGRIGSDGVVTEFALPASFGSELAGITAAPDGGLWFTAPRARMVGRLSPSTGHVTSFHTSWNPYAITSGPSHAVWFAMTDSGRWTITRLVPAGYMAFFQVPGPVKGLAAGPDDGIYIAHGASVERLEPFIGASPIRNRKLKVNPFAGSVSMRLYCPWYDLVSCAGKIVLRWHDQVVATVPFSQRVNDAPATRLLLNGLGRRLTRRSRRVPVSATITQHDQGGTTRERSYEFTLVRKG
jgi:virginiamycin B lyase